MIRLLQAGSDLGLGNLSRFFVKQLMFDVLEHLQCTVYFSCSIVILIRSSKNNKTWKTNFFCILSFRHSLAWMDPEGVQGFGSSPTPYPEKSQVAIGFLRNTGMDLPQEAIVSEYQIGPTCIQLPLKGGSYVPP